MKAPESAGAARHGLLALYHAALQRAVLALAYIAGAALMVMVVVVSLDVVLRALRIPFKGAYDIVRIAAAVTIAAALPYTTAIKGHVAIEYFFHKLGPRARVAVDTLMRGLAMLLFALLAWGCLDYGNSLRAKGEVSMTLQWPIFWVPYVLALSCALVVLIKLHHLTHPGKPMIRP
jgi:TRAP-type C4-dicarboxylate transport system permease small subunit